MCYVYYHRKTRPTTTARRGIAGAAAWSPLWPTGKAANPRDRLRDLNQEAVMGRSGAPWFLGRSRTQPHVCVRCDIYIYMYIYQVRSMHLLTYITRYVTRTCPICAPDDISPCWVASWRFRYLSRSVTSRRRQRLFVDCCSVRGPSNYGDHTSNVHTHP